MSKNKKIKKSPISDLMVFRLFMFNDLYRSKMLPIIKSEYFEDPNMKEIFEKVIEVFEKNNKFPKSIKGIVYRNHWGNKKDVLQEKLDIVNVDKKELELIPVEDYLESIQVWLQGKAFVNVIKSGFNTLNDVGSVDFLDYSDRIKKISKLSFDTEIGLNLRDNKKIIDIYQKSSPKIKMNNEHWDYVTAGGCAVGTLNVLMGMSHSGKSRHMINMAMDYIKDPNTNVLYISLEMTNRQMMERFDSLLLNTTTKELRELILSNDEDKIALYEQAKDKLLAKMGQIVVKRYPASTANIIDFSNLMYNLRAQNFVPRVVFIDYLGTGTTSDSLNLSSHELGRKIAEQYRDFFEQEQVVGWTSVQTYQGTQKSQKDMNMFDVAGSKAIAATADLFGVIKQPPSLVKTNQQIITLDKNREEGIIGTGIIYQLGNPKFKVTSIGIRNSVESDEEETEIKDEKGSNSVRNASNLRNKYLRRRK
jgi:archaellum biogenesis ATPase FlaH